MLKRNDAKGKEYAGDEMMQGEDARTNMRRGGYAGVYKCEESINV